MSDEKLVDGSLGPSDLSAILEATPDFVGMTDPGGRLLYINRAGRRMVGLAPEEDLAGTRITDYLPRRIRHWFLEEVVPEAIRNGSWQGETPFLSRDGHLVSTSQVVLAHTSGDGTLQRLSTIARDLTYRDQAVAATEAYRQERYVAQTLQDALLPALPSLKDLEITARYRSAGHPAEVGGDWYDGFVLPDGDLAVVVGDVMGHDARAAATMGQVRSMVRALACDTGANPSYVLGRLDLLNECLGLTPFTTLVLAQVHTAPEGRWLRWSNAGHPPPLLIGRDGTGRALGDPPGTVLGAGTPGDRVDGTARLAPGATLLLYTDGLVETRGTSLEEGIAGLFDHVAKAADASLEALCDHVFEGFPAPGWDDIALLGVRIPDDEEP